MIEVDDRAIFCFDNALDIWHECSIVATQGMVRRSKGAGDPVFTDVQKY